jgi:2-(1,2-epoxy-1,2-dihydrophenyl)acetyl-CoA isomerase
MPNPYRHICLDIEAGIATLTLTRPDCLNSFNVDMHGEVADALALVSHRTKRFVY